MQKCESIDQSSKCWALSPTTGALAVYFQFGFLLPRETFQLLMMEKFLKRQWPHQRPKSQQNPTHGLGLKFLSKCWSTFWKELVLIFLQNELSSGIKIYNGNQGCCQRKGLISKQHTTALDQLTDGNTAKVYTKTLWKNFCQGHKEDPKKSGISLSLSISQSTSPFHLIL